MKLEELLATKLIELGNEKVVFEGELIDLKCERLAFKCVLPNGLEYEAGGMNKAALISFFEKELRHLNPSLEKAHET